MQFLGVGHRKNPRDASTPIVTHEVDLFIVQGFDQAKDIVHERGNTVVFFILRLVAQVLAALVRYDDTASRLHQRGDLFPPPIPKFRKAVQENDRDSAFRSCLDNVQADSVGVDITMFKFHYR